MLRDLRPRWTLTEHAESIRGLHVLGDKGNRGVCALGWNRVDVPQPPEDILHSIRAEKTTARMEPQTEKGQLGRRGTVGSPKKLTTNWAVVLSYGMRRERTTSDAATSEADGKATTT